MPTSLQRRRQRSAPTGRGPRITPGRIGIVLSLAFATWVGSGFASKLYLAYRLNSEVRRLQVQNQGISDANHGYQDQLNALSQPGGEEEVLRQHGYSLPGETVYVIVRPSPATPAPRGGTPSPSPSPPRHR